MTNENKLRIVHVYVGDQEIPPDQLHKYIAQQKARLIARTLFSTEKGKAFFQGKEVKTHV